MSVTPAVTCLLCTVLLSVQPSKVTAKTPFKPNILVLLPDQWRGDFADDYFLADLPIKTPLFSSLAINGVRFPRAISAAPLCAPSRACFASGREFSATGVPNNGYDFPLDMPNLYQILRDEGGYTTMTTGKDDLTKQTGCGINGDYRARQLGFVKWARTQGKADSVHDYPDPSDPYGSMLSQLNQTGFKDTSVYDAYGTWLANKSSSLPSSDYACCNDGFIDTSHFCPGVMNFTSQSLFEDDYITDQTLRLLDEVSESPDPWFMQVNLASPHPPFAITRAMNESVEGRNPIPMPINASAEFQTEDMVLSRQQYISLIEHNDELFTQIFEAALQASEHRPMLVCMFSDHGEMLGDFEHFGKSLPWFGSMNVPLVCAGFNGFGLARGLVFPQMTVSLVDLTATLLDAAGIEMSTIRNRTGMTSVSLLPWLKGEERNSTDYREYLQSGLYHWRTVIEQSSQLKLVCCNHSCVGHGDLEPNYGVHIALLFNSTSDVYDQYDLSAQRPDDVNRLVSHLRDDWCQT